LLQRCDVKIRVSMEEIISQPNCVTANYRIIGTKGIRDGESGCIKNRIPKVLKQYKRCIGTVKSIEISVESNKEQRLRNQKEAILQVWNSKRPSCNRILS
jgi:hypothetical protein